MGMTAGNPTITAGRKVGKPVRNFTEDLIGTVWLWKRRQLEIDRKKEMRCRQVSKTVPIFADKKKGWRPCLCVKRACYFVPGRPRGMTVSPELQGGTAYTTVNGRIPCGARSFQTGAAWYGSMQIPDCSVGPVRPHPRSRKKGNRLAGLDGHRASV